uniref:Uncharacterized protein n=1 Tax=Aegilops tauschii subsp. strangulata TaxID=200361 RepID=A0A453SXW4_AEGTS
TVDHWIPSTLCVLPWCLRCDHFGYLEKTAQVHCRYKNAAAVFLLLSGTVAGSIFGEGLHEDLHATTQAEHQVQGGFLLDIVISKGASVLKLLAGKDQALLVRWDALLVLDLCLHIVDRVG